jgi:hypothetical protein
MGLRIREIVYVDRIMMFYLLRMFNYITAVVDYVNRQSAKLIDALKPEYFVFFDQIDMPYPEKLVNVTANLSAEPVWRYSKDTHTFFEWGYGCPILPLSLPYLSMEILVNGTVHYDLSEFVSKVKVCCPDFSAASYPCFSSIIGAWMLDSGVVLDPKKTVVVRIIDDTAETHEITMCSICEEDESEEEQLETLPEVEAEVEVGELSEAEPLLSAEVSTNTEKED